MIGGNGIQGDDGPVDGRRRRQSLDFGHGEIADSEPLHHPRYIKGADPGYDVGWACRRLGLLHQNHVLAVRLEPTEADVADRDEVIVGRRALLTPYLSGCVLDWSCLLWFSSRVRGKQA